VIIGNLEIKITIFLGEPFPHVSYMDAPNRTAGTGMIAEQGVRRKPLTRDAGHFRVGGLQKISDRQGLHFIERCHVYRGAYVMILMHDLGCSQLPVYFLIEFSIGITLREIKNFVTNNYNGFKVL